MVVSVELRKKARQRSGARASGTGRKVRGATVLDLNYAGRVHVVDDLTDGPQSEIIRKDLERLRGTVLSVFPGASVVRVTKLKRG